MRGVSSHASSRFAAPLVIILAILVSVLAPSPAAAPAFAAGPLAVNSTLFQGADAAPGNGVCATAAGVCTLRAALEEANALGGNVTVTVADGFTGTITASDCTPAGWMYSSPLPNSVGAYYAITAPNITLDLKNRLSVIPNSDCDATALYVNGADAVISNITNIIGGDTSYVVGAGGKGALFSSVTTVQTVSYFLERTITLMNGADDVTVTGSRFSGNYGTGDVSEGEIEFAAGAAVSNLRVIGNAFTNDTTTGGGCSAVDGRGCRRSAIASQAGTTVAGLVVRGNTFDNMSGAGRGAIRFYCQTVTLSNLDVNGNTIRAVSGSATLESSMISLPCNLSLGGVNLIRGNRITTTTAGTGAWALYWDGPVGTANSTTPSNLTISDNYFDGFGVGSVGTIRMYQTGIVTVQRNTFGNRSVASTSSTSETSTATFFNNYDTTANRQIRTWYPTAVSVNSAACTITMTLTRPTARVPTAPASVDVYFGTGVDAEQYIGSAAVNAATSTTSVTLPYTNSVAGYVRVQSQGSPPATGSQIESSQFSRRLAVGSAAACAPRLTVDQSSSQADPTSERLVAFTVISSEVLTASGVGSLQPSDFSTAGSTAAGVQVVSVTKLSDVVYSVIAKADDSGTIVLSLPAGVVTDSVGTPSLASTSTDNSVAYVNPLSRTPAALTVYQGAPGESYTVTRPVTLPPTGDIVVTNTLSNAWVTAAASTTLVAGAASTPTTVTSAALGGQTRTSTITHTVTSTDANYDGLLLPAVSVTALLPAVLTPTQGPTSGGQAVTLTVSYLPAAVTGVSFGTSATTFTGSGGGLTVTSPPYPTPTGVNVTVDVTVTYANGTVVVLPGAYTYVPLPGITVTKRAYSDAGRTLPLASGTTILAGQHVYWSYTVVNSGQTPLTPVTVTDPQLPSATYPGGLVCTVPSLAPAATVTCTADAVVTP